MSFQTPADIAEKHFVNTDQRLALKADIEELYELKAAEIRAACADIAEISAQAERTAAEIKSDITSMSLPSITIEP